MFTVQAASDRSKITDFPSETHSDESCKKVATNITLLAAVSPTAFRVALAGLPTCRSFWRKRRLRKKRKTAEIKIFRRFFFSKVKKKICNYEKNYENNNF
jgi:hypothetical protein